MDVNKLKELPDGKGNFGKCYIMDDKTLYKEFYKNSYSGYSFKKENLKRITNIKNDSFIFPKKLYTKGDEVLGYTMDYIHADRMDKLNYNFSIIDFIYAFDVLKENLKKINDERILMIDAGVKNTLFNGNFYIIDTDFYEKNDDPYFDYNSNEEYIVMYLYEYLILRENKYEMLNLIEKSDDLRIVNDDLMKKFNISTFKIFLYELREEICKINHRDIDNFSEMIKVLKRKIK